MKLYYSEVLMPRKACAVARHLRSPVDFVHVDLVAGENRTPAYLALNPNGKVPLLVEDGEPLWESNAIMCRLAMIAESDLWPADRRQAEILRWLSWDGEHFTRHGGTLYFEHLVRPLFGMGPPDGEVVQAATRGFRQGAAILERHLGNRDWLVGDRPTVADFALAVALPYAPDARIPLGDFPAIDRWHDRLGTLEGWREPFPGRG